ncbi:MAG: hypothetical protein DRN08_05275 [Thermoplasmata archaeon]|nr:MAG: hypothetical protein DRN08_05275 [Thermoplasmata archaeon]
MPTSIPSEEELLKLAQSRTGKTIEQLKKEIDEYAQGFARFLRKERRLITYLYLKKVLGIQPKLPTVPPPHMITLDELKRTQVKSRLSTQGYIVNIFTTKTRKGSEAIGFDIIDVKSAMRGKIYFSDAIENWKQAKVRVGDFVRLKNISVSDWKDRRTIRISSDTIIEKVNSPPYELEECATKIADLVEGVYSLISVVVLSYDERTYIGCPYCAKGINAQPGQVVTCPKCNEDVLVKELKWINILASDNDDDIKMEITPSVLAGNEQLEDYLNDGGILNVFGRYRDGVFRVENIIPSISRHYEEPTVKIQERFASEEEESKVVNLLVERIPLIVEAWGERTEEQIIEVLKRHMGVSEESAKKAIKACLALGKIVWEEREVDGIKEIVYKVGG